MLGTDLGNTKNSEHTCKDVVVSDLWVPAAHPFLWCDSQHRDTVRLVFVA